MHALGVEAIGRLVEDEYLGFTQEGGSEPEALAHAERKTLHTTIADGSEPDLVKHLVHAGASEAGGGAQHTQVVPRPAAGVETGGLEHRPDVTERIHEVAIGLAIDRRVPCRRLDEAEQHSQGSGLARAVWSEEPRDAAVCNLEAEIVDSDDISESFGQAAYLDGCHDATVRWWRHKCLAIATDSPLRPRTGMDLSDLCLMGEEADTPFHYDRPMGTALDLAKRTQALGRRYPLAADTLLAVALAAAALVSLAAIYDELPATGSPFSHGWTVAVVVSMLALTLPLAWRRRFPFSVAVVAVTAFLVARIVVHVPEANVSLLAAWLMIYSVAVHGQRRFRTPVLIVCYIAIVAELVREYFFASFANGYGPLLARFFDLFYNMLVLTLPWLLGAAIWSLRDRQRKLADQTVELQAERVENASQAVFAERVRIARELHDVVAHHVSVIGVQAAAARRVMDRQPAQAAEALSSIEGSSRRAVTELHRLLGFLRRAGEPDELVPQPGLAQLGDLIAEAGQGELIVDLTIKGEARPLSPTLEVSAYRVIQEALTNTRKHSRASTANIRLQYGLTELEVEIFDDGPERDGEQAGGQVGHGLIGMRERAALHGGHLRAGPRAEGGFSVHASFPLNSDAA
jgi:signal transduction histidine kinase